MESSVPELLIKPVVYWEFWICDYTGSGMLIKPVVYEEFWTCKFKGPGLLIKPAVYAEFWRCYSKCSELLIKPVVYEKFRMPDLDDFSIRKSFCVHFYHFRPNYFFKLAGVDSWKIPKNVFNGKIVFGAQTISSSWRRVDNKRFGPENSIMIWTVHGQVGQGPNISP